MISHHTPQRKLIAPIVFIALTLLLVGLTANFYQSKIKKLEQRIVDLKKQSGQPNNSNQDSNQTTPDPLMPTNTYENNEYKYTLQYPRNLQIQTANAKMSNIGLFDSSISEDYMAGKTRVEIREGKKTDNFPDDAEKIIFNLIKPLCDADGRGASISCPRKKSFQPLVLPSGLKAYTLTLEQDTRTLVPEESITTDDKIFYIIDLTTGTIPTFLATYSIGDGTNELAKQIAESVSMLK